MKNHDLYFFENEAQSVILVGASKLGRHETAFNASKRSIELMGHLFPLDHYRWVNSYMNHGFVLSQSLQFDEAISYYHKARTRVDTTFPIGLRNYAFISHQLSYLYAETGSDKELEYLNNAINALKSYGDTTSLNYLRILHNIGQYYSKTNQSDRAISIYEYCIARTKEMDDFHPLQLTTYYMNYAIALGKTDRTNQALDIVNEALEIHEQFSKTTNPSWLRFKFLSHIYNYQHADNLKSYQLLEQYLHYSFIYTHEILNFLTEQRRGNYIENIFYWDIFKSFVDNIFYYNDSDLGLYFVEFIANFSDLNESISRREWVYRVYDDNKGILSSFDELTDLRSNYSAASLAGASEKMDSIGKLIILAEENFKMRLPAMDMAHPGFLPEWITYDQIISTLGDDEVILLFTQYRFRDKEYVSADYTPSYGVIIVDPKNKGPVVLDLCHQEEINQSFMNFDPLNSPSYLTNTQLNLKLSKSIWHPIYPFIKDKKHVFIRPIGDLHSISFGALQNPSGDKEEFTFGIEEFTISYLAHLNHLAVSKEKELASYNKLILFGNPDFDAIPENAFKVDQNVLNKLTRDSYLNEYFQPLPGAELEFESIQTLANNNKIDAVIISGIEASKEAFSNLSGKSADILHITTHGFFQKETESVAGAINRPREVFTKNGLAFAGANLDVSNLKENSIDGKLNGIITAYEIASLNFTNIPLVILSACETALGPTNIFDGVYGLQRAFRLAGVNTLIGALWSIPDAETAEFMTLFYENLLVSNNPSKALRAAQIQISETHPPYYWAGFVLVE